MSAKTSGGLSGFFAEGFEKKGSESKDLFLLELGIWVFPAS